MNTPLPTPLPYAPVLPRNRFLDWRSFVPLLGVTTFSTVLFLGLTAFVTPSFSAIFKDFKSPIPRPTQLALSLSDAIISGGAYLVLVLAMALLLTGLMFDRLRPEPRAARRYAFIVVILLLLADLLWTAFFVCAMFLPMLSLTNSVWGK